MIELTKEEWNKKKMKIKIKKGYPQKNERIRNQLYMILFYLDRMKLPINTLKRIWILSIIYPPYTNLKRKYVW